MPIQRIYDGAIADCDYEGFKSAMEKCGFIPLNIRSFDKFGTAGQRWRFDEHDASVSLYLNTEKNKAAVDLLSSESTDGFEGLKGIVLNVINGLKEGSPK
jgi:hypothetical protein